MMADESKMDVFETLPLLPLRDVVLFPYMMMPFIVGRGASVKALEAGLRMKKKIFFASQKDAHLDTPSIDDIYSLGTIGNVVQNLKLPNKNQKVLVEGIDRARVVDFRMTDEGFYEVTVKLIKKQFKVSPNIEKLTNRVISLFEKYIKFSNNLTYETMISAIRIDDPNRLGDTIAAHLAIKVEEKQNLLEIVNAEERLIKISEILEFEIDKLKVDRKIQNKVRKQMESAQKEYYLNEKIKAIHSELGGKEGKFDEFEELRKKIKEARMAGEAERKAEEELKRLEVMPAMSAEATVSRNYLDWLLAVPWYKKTRESRDIKRAHKILEEDHYGLEKIKERILEFLAVRQMVKNVKGSILCFVGPPGTGKSSLATSIARATGRKFVRISLGGVRDEAEIRGHRRTYIGAFPGQIIQMMKKAGTKNPVFLLDEVDKMSMDFRGDPSAALMEVLDPEQNNTFVDHYLDVEYDLSSVMFITTANIRHTIPRPLQDRMEILQLSGYTVREKLAIAQRHLAEKQIAFHGLKKHKLRFQDEAIEEIIDHYTREAGVRNLEREIANICRKIVKQIVQKKRRFPRVITKKQVAKYLGVPKFRRSKLDDEDEVGVVRGLAWTENGGELMGTEVSIMSGKGNLNLTGQLGEVMQESAKAAYSYIRSKAQSLGLSKNFYKNIDIHIHVPEGAIPKDGPSAGITLATALVSALIGIPVKHTIAMTGEITLRGKVLPVGGVKEKLLAAHRNGIKTIILPSQNEKDLIDIPQDILKSMELKMVRKMEEVLEIALPRAITQIEELRPFPGESITKKISDHSVTH